MPKSKNDNSHRSWSREECFAHNKNLMAERGLQHTLNTLGREKFHDHSKKKMTITEVRETLLPLSLTTGYLEETENHRMLQIRGLEERRVKFDDEYVVTDSSNLVQGASLIKHCVKLKPKGRTGTCKKTLNISDVDYPWCKQRRQSIGEVQSLSEGQSRRKISTSISERERNADTQRSSSCPPSGLDEKKSQAEKLSSHQVAKINQFYLNKMKKTRRLRSRSGTYKSGSKGLIDIEEIEAKDRKPIYGQKNEKSLAIDSERKLPHNSKWALVTIEKLLNLRDQLNENDPEAVLLKSRQLVKMPKLYQVYWSNIERFREMAVTARTKRRKSDVSTIGTENESGTSGCESQTEDQNQDSGSETESLEIRDDVEKRLWRNDKDPEINGKRRYKEQMKSPERNQDITAVNDSSGDLRSKKRLDIFIPHTSTNAQDNVEYAADSQNTFSNIDISETPYFLTPVYSLSLNSSLRNNRAFESTKEKLYCNHQHQQHSFNKSPTLKRQVSFVGQMGDSGSAFRKQDNSRISHIYLRQQDGDKEVPLAQFVRAVEHGLSIAGFIHKVADLKVPLSGVIIRREREKMVRSHTPRRVRSDKEKARMKEIQERIEAFLLTLP